MFKRTANILFEFQRCTYLSEIPEHRSVFYNQTRSVSQTAVHFHVQLADKDVELEHCMFTVCDSLLLLSYTLMYMGFSN